MKKKNRKLYKILPSFLCFILFLCPLKTYAADSGGTTYVWDGDLFFHDQGFTIPLFNVFANSEMITEDNDVLGKYKVASFSGSASNLLQVNGTVGTYLNGVATTTYTFTADGDYEGVVSAQLTSGQYDGLIVSSSQQRVDNNLVVVKVFVTFNNFEITSSTMYFPIQFDVSYSSRYDEVYMNIPYAVAVMAQGSDWTDQIAMYNSMDDLPNSKGFIARAFDSIKTHLSGLFNELIRNENVNHGQQLNATNDGFDSVNTNMGNYFNVLNQNLGVYNNQQIANQNQNSANQIANDNANNASQIANDNANSQAEINQSKENTDNLMNGFDTDKSTSTTDSIKSGLSDYSATENEIVSISALFNDGTFTFAEIPSDFDNAFGFVSSLLQGIFEASGNYGIIVASSFSFIIFRMICGHSKFI